jgi:hypothetical protein
MEEVFPDLIEAVTALANEIKLLKVQVSVFKDLMQEKYIVEEHKGDRRSLELDGSFSESDVLIKVFFP